VWPVIVPGGAAPGVEVGALGGGRWDGSATVDQDGIDWIDIARGQSFGCSIRVS
jgi:hypothetical protein